MIGASKSALAGVIACCLCSCTTGPFKSALRSTDAEPEQAAPEQAAADQAETFTRIGRNALDADHVAAAIVAFRQALDVGEEPGPALNGMGVAYARLGRIDLAERYFLRAIDQQSGDDRYLLNLVQLMGSDEYLARRQPTFEEKLLSQPLPDDAGKPAPTRNSAMARDETGAIMIRTSGQSAAAGTAQKLARIGSRTVHKPAPEPEGFQPVVRINLATRDLRDTPDQPPADAAPPRAKSKTVNFARFVPVVRLPLSESAPARARD